MPRKTLKGGVEDPLRKIDFEEVLGELHGYIGRQVEIKALVSAHFFGLSFVARLESIDTLPPDDLALTLHFDGGSVDLDPAESTAYIGGGGQGKPTWLELTVDRGRTTLTLEARPEPLG